MHSAERVGPGFWAGVVPYLVARKVEAKPARYTLRGSHLSKAPIDELARRAVGTFLTVEGEIVFDPKPGVIDRLNGQLGKDGSAVWIEEFETGNVVSERITAN